MAKYPIFLSDLAEGDRKHIRHCTEMLERVLRGCEGRLRRYEAEDAKAECQSVLKLLHDLKVTSGMIDEMKNELVEKHRLPDDLKQIDEALRQDIRKVFTGTQLE